MKKSRLSEKNLVSPVRLRYSKPMSLIKSVATVGGFTFLSRIVGFVRDILIARFLGASMMADAFFVAFRLPNLFRSLFAEGTLNVAFVPVFSAEMVSGGKRRALYFARSAFGFLFYVLLGFTLIMEVIMPALMFLMAPGFADIPGKLELATQLARIAFPFLLCVSLVSLLSGVLNSAGRFWAAAFVSTLMNLTMIASLFVITPFLSSPYAPAYALSIGVFIAGAVELLWMFWHVKRAGFLFGLIGPVKALFKLSKSVKLLLRRMAPGVLGSGVYQINLFLDTFFVSFVGAGAISWLNYAHHLFQLPVGIIGVAIGTALLPVLSQHIKAGHQNEAVFELNRGLEISLAFSLASMVGLLFLAHPIICVLFERGAFTADDTVHTARALTVFAIGLPAYMLTKALSPFFYARGDTTTPVKIAVVGVALNAVLALCLMQFWGYAGIAAATSITVWVNAFQYIVRIWRQGDFKADRVFYFKAPRIFASVLVMAFVLALGLFVSTNLFPGWQNENGVLSVVLLCLLIVGGGFSFGASLILTGSISMSDIKRFLRRKRTVEGGKHVETI